MIKSGQALLAVVDGGIVLVTPQVEVLIEADRPHRDLCDALGAIVDADANAAARSLAVDERSAREAIGLVSEHGASALDRAPIDLPGVRLAEAVLFAAAEGRPPTERMIWTGEELLVLPEETSDEVRLAALRAFVGGAAPTERMLAYGYCWRAGTPTLVGDLPDGEQSARAVELAAELDGDRAHVIALRSGTVDSLPISEIGTPVAGGARLGMVQALAPLDLPALSRAGFSSRAARYAHPNPPRASKHQPLWGQGVAGTAETAEEVAVAEAIERYASGDLTGRRLVRARHADLPDSAPTPEAFLSYCPRQHEAHKGLAPFDPEARYLWVEALSAKGQRTWAPAELVFYPFVDPERSTRLGWATSSGVAALPAGSAARRMALFELIERDALMWTWRQRVQRDRLAPDALPANHLRLIEALAGEGLQTTFVDLTLDTLPVVLCCVHSESRLSLGAACRPSHLEAMEKSLREAAALDAGRPPDSIEPAAVETVGDHVKLYGNVDMVAEAAWLYSAPTCSDPLDLDTETPTVDEALAPIGEPLTVDLTPTGMKSTRVIRALMPDLIPISFGYDREPQGMVRGRIPIATRMGGVLGATLDGADAPLTPHPFA